MWADDSTLSSLRIDKHCLNAAKNEAISQDSVFHTLLGIGGISAEEYKQQLDLANKCKNNKILTNYACFCQKDMLYKLVLNLLLTF